MGISGGYASWAALAASVTTAVVSADDSSRRAGHAKDDAERAKKEAELTQATNANARIAAQRKAMQNNSLSTGGGAPGAGSRTTLGV